MSELWTRGKNHVFTIWCIFLFVYFIRNFSENATFHKCLICIRFRDFCSHFIHFLQFVVLLKHCWFGFEIMQKMMTMCYGLQKMKNNYRIPFLCMHSATCWLMLHAECRCASSKNCTTHMSHACRHSHLFLNT